MASFYLNIVYFSFYVEGVEGSIYTIRAVMLCQRCQKKFKMVLHIFAYNFQRKNDNATIYILLYLCLLGQQLGL